MRSILIAGITGALIIAGALAHAQTKSSGGQKPRARSGGRSSGRWAR